MKQKLQLSELKRTILQLDDLYITSFSTSLNDTIQRTDYGAEDLPEGDLVWLATRLNCWSSTVISQKASGMH